MVTYLSDIPKATDSPSTSQGQILNNFAYLSASMGRDHNFTSNSANVTDGFHKQVTFASNQAAPGFGAGVSDLFSNTTAGVASLWWQNASGAFPITGFNPVAAANGYTCLPGGVFLQWGVRTCGASTAITWPIGFSAFYSVTCTVVFSGVGTSVPVVQVQNPTNLGCTIRLIDGQSGTGISGTRNVYFMAIGTKV